VDLTGGAGFYFLRLAFFFGFVGLMRETFRIMSSKRDGWLGGCVSLCFERCYRVTVLVSCYRVRIRQAETLGEFGLSESLRAIIVQEQDHEIDLSAALGINVPPPIKPADKK
jgi:hypothetical protein